MPGADFNQSTGAGLGYRTGSGTAALGESNSTGGKFWLPIWSGEVLHAYDEYNVFESLVDHKTISSGREMLFPRTGTVALEPQWGAGEELVGGSDTKASQFSVSLDARPMASHFELDNVDLMVTQWEYRAELARQAGLVLANTRDKQIASYIATAAIQSKLSGIVETPAGYGTNVTNMGMEDARDMHDGQFYCDAILQASGADTGAVWSANNGAASHTGSASAAITTAERTLAALKILEMIEANLVHLQTINAPLDQIYCAVPPKAFQEIRALGVARAAADAVNSQPFFGGVAAAGGLGAPFSQGLNALTDTLTYMGVIIMKSNHCPVVDYTIVGGANNIGEGAAGTKYHKTWAACGVKAIMWQRSAIAALSLQGLKVDTVDDVRRNTTFTVASMMNGTGVMRPELSAIFIDSTSSSDADGTCTVGNVTDEACGGTFVSEYSEAT
jgi:hypothetical protein